VTLGVILRPSSQFYQYFFSSMPRKNMIKLTLVPQNAYLGSQKHWCKNTTLFLWPWESFEALESVLLIFFLVYTSKKYDQTDSCAPKYLLWVTKTVMYIVKIQHCFCDLGSHFEALKSFLLIFFLAYASKKYDQTDSCALKCLPRVTKTVMYIVNTLP
jgi:hypothetical protein